MIAFALALVLAQASPTAVPTPLATTTPVPQPSASTLPHAPVQAGSAGPTAAPVYNFVYKPTPSPYSTPFPELDAPEIYEIDVTDSTIAAPGPLHVRVLTSDSVVSLVAASFGYEFSIPKTGIGTFKFDADIPAVPDAVKNKRFDVDITATSRNGRVFKMSLPFMLK